jgi:hypothetical protein
MSPAACVTKTLSVPTQIAWTRVGIGRGTSVAATLTMLAAVTSLAHDCSDEQRRTLDPYEWETY